MQTLFALAFVQPGVCGNKIDFIGRCSQTQLFQASCFLFFFLNCTKYPSEYSSFKTLSLGLSYFLNFNRCHCLLCATGVCGNKIYFTGRCSQTQPFQASCFLFFFLKCTKYPSKYSSFKTLSLGLSYFLNFNQYHCILPPSLSKT